MTTPAVNDNLTSTVTGTRWQRATCSSPFVQNLTAVCQIKNLQEARPASVNNPRSRSGWRNPSPWSHSKLLHNPHPLSTVGFFATSCGKVNTEYRDGAFWPGSANSGLPTFPSYLSGVARSRMLSRLKDQKVNLAVAFAEADQTMDLFKGACRTIADAVRAFRGKFPKEWGQVVKNGVKNQFRGIPRRWLELQYGWKPLMSDVYGSCEELDRHTNDPDAFSIRVVGKATDNSTRVWSKVGSVTTSGRLVVTEKVTSHCKVICYYNLARPNLARFVSLGLTNPGELIWEKLPYSFVIDWFIPIGSWLSNFDADLGWDFRSGTETRFASLVADSKFTHGPSYPPGISSLTYSGDAYKAKGFSMTRSVLSSPPSAGLPRFKNPLSSHHIANALSLLVEAFRR